MEKKPCLKKQVFFSFSTNLFFQTFLKFNQNASQKEKLYQKNYAFLAQVLSLERKCFIKKKKCYENNRRNSML